VASLGGYARGPRASSAAGGRRHDARPWRGFGFHIASPSFWHEHGFGYKKTGSGDGHW